MKKPAAHTTNENTTLPTTLLDDGIVPQVRRPAPRLHRRQENPIRRQQQSKKEIAMSIPLACKVRAQLPARLLRALVAVVAGEGDDLYFVLGYLSPSTARSYMSQLKARGMAYTFVSGKTVEVWAHDKGRRAVRHNGITP